MQDRTLQRSYVKQAASRKNALNLREYPHLIVLIILIITTTTTITI